MRDDEKHIGFLSVELEEKISDGAGCRRVQTTGGLVAEKESRSVDQRPGDRDPLSFAPGQLGGPVKESVRKTDPRQKLLGPCRGLPGASGESIGWQQDVLQNRVLGKKMRFLEDKSDGGIAEPREMTSRKFGWVLPVDFHHAAGWSIEGTDDVQQSTLAGARGPGEYQRLTGL